MTQAITNTKLNTLEDMLSQTQKATDAVDCGMDKTINGFKDILEKSINKTQEDSKGEASVNSQNTIEGLKKVVELTDDTVNWQEFKDLLSDITAEANVETSLDLTLAKDINEIITQLKEAVESTDKIIEEGSSEDIIAEVFGTTDILDVDLMIDENLVVETDENLVQEKEDLKSEQNLSLEQLLQVLNTTVVKPVVEQTSEIEFNNAQKEDLSLAMEMVSDDIDMSQSEIINLSENLVDELVSATSTTEVSDFDLQIDEELLKDLNIESVQAEVDTSTGENLMQNQTPEEYAVKVMINQEVEVFDAKLETSVQTVQNAQQVQTKAVDVNPSRIIDQVLKHLENLQNNSKVSIVLNPESLGKLDIQLLTTKEGLSAQFTVATQEAREILMKGLDGLKESLTSHGVGVDNVSVKVAEGQKSEYKQDWTEQDGSRGGNKKQDQPNREEKEKGLFEKMMAQHNEEENGNV